MEPRVSYALVGLFIIGLATALVGAGLWLTTGLKDGNYQRYSVYMSESTFGLGPDSRVLYYGVGVGQVVDVRLSRRGEDRNVHAVIRVETEEPLREGTVASLKVRGITGIAYIELTGGEKGEPLRPPPGEPYPVIPYEPSLVMRLDQAVTDGMDTLEDIGGRINDLLSPENVRRVEATLANVQSLTAELGTTSRRLRRTLDQVDRTLVAGGEAAGEAERVLSRGQGTLDDVSRAAASVAAAAEKVSAFSSDGQTAMQRVTADTLPELRALSAELGATARSLRRLSESLQRDPSQLLRGRNRRQEGSEQ